MNEVENLFDMDLYSYFYELVRQIPRGMVSTYGDLARALGDVVASRACGYMLSINPDPEGTPCYKVVRSDGTVGKYTHILGEIEKIRRLEKDGIIVEGDSVKNFEQVRFKDFQTDFPLNALKNEQEKVASMVNLTDDFDSSRIAAVDVSYDDDYGYGAMAIDDGGKIEIRESVQRVQFPYIPGYLAFREFKFIKDLARGFDGILLIDGNGLLHPRKIGLASYAGVMLNVATIGVAKSLLMGTVSDNWVYMGDEKVAYVINKNTIVSPGHRVSLGSSVDLVKKLGHGKYPEL
ncbi:MAG: endonuclease V, partial [Candidatus Thermoplasmatota archaeon]|nr:endonuclease V [Candidatus Thermoplasmatota archaeon]